MAWEFLRHQQKLIEKCKEIVSGRTAIKRIISHVVPGHGKSCSGPILASYLIPAKVDRICWVVPRTSLQEQAETVFLDGDIRNALKHSHKIRRATNDINPCRGYIGYTTTYQAIAQDSGDLNKDEFAKHRYGLILDEPQHLELDESWHRSIQPLYDQAAFVLMMSGELSRGNRKRVAFVNYKECGPGRWTPDLTDTDDTFYIQSTIEEALREQKIIATYFEELDGNVRFMDKEGDIQTETIGGAGQGENFKLLWGALNTEYAFDLLNACYLAFRKHRRQNPRAKMLVVAPDISSAEKYLKWFDGQVSVRIATSEDTPSALKAIRAFKSFGSNSVDVLVTVQMAYEGLDVPSITHVACLTYIRSKPWIYQMIARGWRMDYQSVLPWGQQRCTVYCPNDPLMKKCIDRIKKAMAAIVFDPKPGPPPPPPPPLDHIVPLDSHAHGGESTAIDTDETISGDEWFHWFDRRSKFHAEDIPILEFKRIYNENRPDDTSAPPDEPDLPPSVAENQIKDAIERYSQRWCYAKGEPHDTLNKLIKAHFGKGRDLMEMPELEQVWVWILKNYPI
jgi:superfamily II DNA or RNA helicase